MATNRKNREVMEDGHGIPNGRVRIEHLGVVMEHLGLTINTFRHWCDARIIPSIEGGGRSGSRRYYSFRVCLGAGVGAFLYVSERGCNTSYVAKLVKTFSTTDLKDLEKAVFEEGYRYFLGVEEPRIVTGREEDLIPGQERIDLRGIWELFRNLH